MILLEAQDFKMEQAKETNFFSLSMPAIINKGKPNERTEMKVISHTMTFEACMKYLVSHRMAELEESFTISEYIKRYQEEVNSICDLVQFIPTEVSKETPEEEEEINPEDEEV